MSEMLDLNDIIKEVQSSVMSIIELNLIQLIENKTTPDYEKEETLPKMTALPKITALPKMKETEPAENEIKIYAPTMKEDVETDFTRGDFIYVGWSAMNMKLRWHILCYLSMAKKMVRLIVVHEEILHNEKNSEVQGDYTNDDDSRCKGGGGIQN